MTKAEIQLVKSLGDKRARQEAGLFVVEGRKAVEEFVGSSGFEVRKIYVVNYESATQHEKLDIEMISGKEMERMSHLKTPTDCLALVELPRWELRVEEELRGRLTLALDEVQNPGNVGTIIRLADWFGIENIICSEGTADCFGPKVVQATMGALTRVRVHYGELGEMMEGRRVPVYGTFLEGESVYEAELGQEGIIVLGSEGRGISKEVEEMVNRKLSIPAYRSGSESLNVAVAAAIICSKFRNP